MHRRAEAFCVAAASSLHTLAAQYPGLVAADLALGPDIVALTLHRVVAAPYHRRGQGILADRAILEVRAIKPRRPCGR